MFGCTDRRKFVMIETLRFIRHSFQILSFFSHQFMIFDHLKINRRELLWSNSLICKFMICRILKWIFNKTKKDERPSQEEQFIDFYTSFWTFTVSYLFFFVFLIIISVFAQPRYGFPIFCFVSREFGLRRISYSFDRSFYLRVEAVWTSTIGTNNLKISVLRNSYLRTKKIMKIMHLPLFPSILSSYFLSFFLFFLIQLLWRIAQFVIVIVRRY